MNSNALNSTVITDEISKVNSSDRSTYTSLPMMTKYEMNQVIGLRTMHLSKGALPLVDLPDDYHINGNMQLREIAISELKQKRLPYLVKRPLPNGKVEYWPVSSLSLESVKHMLRA